jgi:hypothetical protein
MNPIVDISNFCPKCPNSPLANSGKGFRWDSQFFEMRESVPTVPSWRPVRVSQERCVKVGIVENAQENSGSGHDPPS